MLERRDTTIQVGDVVGFKYDIEQIGVVERIDRDWLNTKFTVRYDPTGHGNEETISLLAEDCWEV